MYDSGIDLSHLAFSHDSQTFLCHAFFPLEQLARCLLGSSYTSEQNDVKSLSWNLLEITAAWMHHIEAHPNEHIPAEERHQDEFRRGK